MSFGKSKKQKIRVQKDAPVSAPPPTTSSAQNIDRSSKVDLRERKDLDRRRKSLLGSTGRKRNVSSILGG